MTKTHLIDMATRAGWTLLQAGIAFGITEAAGITAWYAVPLATALSAAKSWVVNKQAAKKAAR